MNRLENIFLMRHAHSAANEDLTLYKQIPDHAIPLSDKGKKQAYEAGKHFAAFLSQSSQPFDKQSIVRISRKDTKKTKIAKFY